MGVSSVNESTRLLLFCMEQLHLYQSCLHNDHVGLFFSLFFESDTSANLCDIFLKTVCVSIYLCVSVYLYENVDRSIDQLFDI